MKHVNHILVIFGDDSGWETSDMFDVKYDIPLKEFIDNFDENKHGYLKREIISAHVVTQSYSPEDIDA